MRSGDTKILEFNQYQKSDKALFFIYADLEFMQILKMNTIDRCKKNPEILSPAKVSEHIPSGISLSTISSIKQIEKNHDV